MKVCKSLKEVCEFTGAKEWQVEEAWSKHAHRGMLIVNNIVFNIHVKDGEMHFVNFNESDNKECKEYFMNYELDNYITKVYTDPIEGWQNCIVLDVLNSNQEIERAIVITKSGTQLNRIAKFVDEDDEIIPDSCIYFIDKNIS